MPAAPGKANVGNRRTGSARRGYREHGAARARTRPWENDPEILERVALVADMYDHPMTTIQRVVNRFLEERGRPTVSIDTIKADRKRVLSLASKKVLEGQGYHNALIRLERIWETTWRSINRTPEGPQRAGLLMVAQHNWRERARMEGIYARPPVEVNVYTDGFGPTPMELLEQGKIDEDEYFNAIKYLPDPTQAGQPVIEGDVRSLDPTPSVVRGPSPRPLHAQEGTPRDDDMPEVVDFDPSMLDE